MSKTADMAKVSAKGSFHLLWGLVVSTVISAVGTIFIARLLGEDQYGLYTVILTVPALISIFRDWGVNYAMIRFTAQYRAEGRIDEIRSIFLSGIIFEIAIGLILSIFSLIFADFLATTVFNRPVIAPLIQLASFVVFANGLIAAGTAVFTGYERMELNSIMLVTQSIFKTVLIITFVLLGLGVPGATIGFTAGTFIAGIIGVLLIWVIYRHLPKPATHRLEIKAYLTTMLQYCLPLSFALIITALLPQFYAFLLPIHYVTDNIVIGNYGVAMNFVVLITFFAMPITTMMFPAFSKLNAEKDKEPLRNIFQFSVKYASLLVVPVTAIVMSLSRPAVETLFGSTYDSAPLFLSLFAIQYLYTAFGNLSLSGLLNGQGQTSFILKMAIVTGIIGFPLGYILIMNFGVLGLITSTLVNPISGIIMGLLFVRKQYSVTVDWSSSAKILISSAITAILTYFIVTSLALPSWIRLIIGVIIFLPTFAMLILLTKTLNIADLNNLRQMTSGLGPVGKIITLFLNIIEKIIIALKI
jgi:O-antigen/teichoic acid export membrane protein